MFNIPDFGHSDLWHFNFSLKFLLSSTLKAGYLPFWSKDIGSGFPVLAEGQVGVFNFFNLLTFRFFDPVTAFNLGYLFIFLTTLFGSYLFGRVTKLSKLTSLYLGIIFSLSGVFVTQVGHFNLIQAASFLPWEFFFIEKFIQTNKKRWLLAFSFVLQQQIFAGFQQSTLISSIGVTLFFIFRSYQEKKLRLIFFYGFSLFLGFVLALPQIIPSRELIQLSFRQDGVSLAEMTRFPFYPKFLLSFFQPYLWGNPINGQLREYVIENTIFWETTGYIGVLPLLLIPFGLTIKRFVRIKNVFLLIFVISLILTLGKFTPFFFVFQIPPLSYFRVPARFLLLFVWALAVLSAIGLEKIKARRLSIIVIVFSFLNLIYFAVTFIPIIKPQEWLAEPESVKIIKTASNSGRIYSVNPYLSWNKVFYKSGWLNIDDYLTYRNALDPNQNLLWKIPSVDFYAGTASRRIEMFKGLIDSGIKIVSLGEEFSISSESAKMLSLASVRFVISPYRLASQSAALNFTLISSTSSKQPFFIYQNNETKPHAYLTNNLKVATTVKDLIEKLIDPQNNAVIVEDNIANLAKSTPSGSINVTKNSDLEVDIKVWTNQKSLLVLTDSYYPGWRAYLNKIPIKIFPVNLNQRGVITPVGEHEIKFIFEPFNFSKEP